MKIDLLPANQRSEVERLLTESCSEEQLPKSEQSVILAASDDGRIAGCIAAERSWVVSPLWIAKKYRGNGLADSLIARLEEFNEENLRELCATTNPHVERLIFSLGFTPIKGQLWRR